MIIIGLAVWIILIVWITIEAVPGFLTAFFISALFSLAFCLLIRYAAIGICKLFNKNNS